MKKILIFLFLYFTSIAANSMETKKIMQELPQLKTASCTFNQHRILPSNTLKSSGNFEFIEGKGVIFYTTHPVKITTSYTSSQNKHINDIIIAISKKDYSYLENNFKLDFSKSNNSWHLTLNPSNKNLKSHLNSVSIKGDSYIKRIIIDTVNNGKTDITFNCGK